MSKLNFKSNVCTSKEQSERLLALGLKKETADMCLSKVNVFCQTFDFMSPHSWTKEQLVSDTWYPAWSLGRLLELSYGDVHPNNVVSISAHNPFEYMIKTIEGFIKHQCFNKEYLENGNC